MEQHLINGRAIDIQLPDWNKVVRFKADAVYSRAPGEYYWAGYNADGSTFHLTRTTEGGMLGTIWDAPTRGYYGLDVLSPETAILIKYLPSYLPVVDGCGAEEEESESPALPPSGSCAPTHSEIRVLFVFSPAAAARLGTFGAAALASRVIGELNGASVGSGLTPAQVSFTLAGVSGLAAFTEDPCSSKTKKALLSNQEVKSLREIFFADIVCLIINDVHLQNPPCDASGNAVNNASADEAYCFAEITAATTQFKATHGIGHVLGLGHQRCLNCWNIRCFASIGNGDAHGFRINAGFRTIMADCDGTTRVPRWSAVGMPFAGSPTGDADNDNARKVGERANAVSCFRADPPPPPVVVTILGTSTICGGGTRTYTVESNTGNVSQAAWTMKTDITL